MLEFLESCAKSYFEEGTSPLTDSEWDALARIHNFNDVGYVPTDGVLHYAPMWSLQKCFDLNKAPDLGKGDVVVTPKLDGAAVALLYVNCKFSQALTRGDGKFGRDVTEKMALRVPAEISTMGIVQITGELVAPDSIENSRNYAAGSLNLKDIAEFDSRVTYFYAYGMEASTDQHDFWSQDMGYLKDQGFSTVLTHITEGFPQDGKVYRLDDYEAFKELGYTSKHPRGAFALKEQQQGVVTKLLDVKWQVGKSGVVSPVAILEPVMVGDAKVSRATLHNIDYINDLGLELGCDVEIIRSGEIIPRVVRRV